MQSVSKNLEKVASGRRRQKGRCLRLVHTSDWHFGCGHEWPWPTDLASRRMKEREAAILRVIDIAEEESADYLVVAGDVCDGQALRPENIAQALNRLKHRGCLSVALFVGRGMHDPFFGWWPGRVVEPAQPLTLPDVRFFGFDAAPSESVIRQAIPLGDTRPNVVICHPNRTPGNLLRLQSLVNYVALGEKHADREVVPSFAYYSGSPTFRDLCSIDPGSRSVRVVDVNVPTVRTRIRRIDTPTSATLDAQPRKEPPFSSSSGEVGSTLDESLIRLLDEGHSYIRVRLHTGEPTPAFGSSTSYRVIPWNTRSTNYKQYLVAR
jgi:hypothetical protein